VIGEWGFDGLKIDGQHLNGVAPCHNPAHHHAKPEASVEGLAHFFEVIYAPHARSSRGGRRALPLRHGSTPSTPCPT
jgi:hypothetical protein